MKSLLVLAIMTLAVQGGPVLQAIDWSEVYGKVDIMQITITNTFDDVIFAAKEDNSGVGDAIDAKLTKEFKIYASAFMPIYRAIDSQSLTESMAREIFAEVKSILRYAMQDIASDLTQLSSGTRERINAMCRDTEASSVALAGQVIDLLSGNKHRTSLT